MTTMTLMTLPVMINIYLWLSTMRQQHVIMLYILAFPHFSLFRGGGVLFYDLTLDLLAFTLMLLTSSGVRGICGTPGGSVVVRIESTASQGFELHAATSIFLFLLWRFFGA